MSRCDDSFAAATAILQGFAKGVSPQPSTPFSSNSSNSSVNGVDLHKFKLPGSNTSAKQAFESELSALARRIQYLECRAETVSQTLPDTPNEFSLPSSPFGGGSDGRLPTVPISRHGSGGLLVARPASISHLKPARVSNLLAARDTRNGEQDTQSRTVSEDDIGYLRDHIHKQAKEIENQREVIANVSKELHEQEEQSKRAMLKVEHEDVGILERELRKHQQANEAFQKALREIGGIITQVANGDLSMRVQIHPSEMDPEIATFKRTINTMMDQLQVFGSEVSRVAREVGTEGILGGQAQITGVHGIWKELTENGKIAVPY